MKLALYAALAVTLSRFGWLAAGWAWSQIEMLYNRHVKRAGMLR